MTRCREVQLLAKAPFELDLPDSPIDMYVLLTNTHDGSGAVTACATPVRVVCMNTLRSALSAAKATCKVRHTSGAEARLAEAQRVLGLTRGAADRVRERAEQMAATRISDADWRAFLHQLVPDPPDSRTGLTRAAKNRFFHPGRDPMRLVLWPVWPRPRQESG